MTVQPLRWVCGHGADMLLILKKLFWTWLLPDIPRYDSPKKCPTILYAVNLWLEHVSATGARVTGHCGLFFFTRSNGTIQRLIQLNELLDPHLKLKKKINLCHCLKSDNNSSNMIFSCYMLFYCPSQMPASFDSVSGCWRRVRQYKNYRFREDAWVTAIPIPLIFEIVNSNFQKLNSNINSTNIFYFIVISHIYIFIITILWTIQNTVSK